jgi:hypothetical protein
MVASRVLVRFALLCGPGTIDSGLGLPLVLA